MNAAENVLLEQSSCELAQAMALAEMILDVVEDSGAGLANALAGVITIIGLAKKRIDDLPPPPKEGA